MQCVYSVIVCKSKKTMQKLIPLFLLFISFNYVHAQTDEKIINELLFDLFGFQQDTILIKCIKTKTYFDYDSVSFEKVTGLTVPARIISEWKSNEEDKDFIAEWNEQHLNRIDTIVFDYDTLTSKKPVFKCLSKDEIDQLFERTKKRQKIYSISNILFDKSKENALFQFTIIPWPGDFSSVTILIKKVFGKWTIITRFNLH